MVLLNGENQIECEEKQKLECVAPALHSHFVLVALMIEVSSPKLRNFIVIDGKI